MSDNNKQITEYQIRINPRRTTYRYEVGRPWKFLWFKGWATAQTRKTRTRMESYSGHLRDVSFRTEQEAIGWIQENNKSRLADRRLKLMMRKLTNEQTTERVVCGVIIIGPKSLNQ